MNLEKTHQLIDWLGTTQPDQQYSLDDMKELLSIAETEISDQNLQMYDGLPGNIVEALIEKEKASGVYYRLDDKIRSYKSRFTE